MGHESQCGPEYGYSCDTEGGSEFPGVTAGGISGEGGGVTQNPEPNSPAVQLHLPGFETPEEPQQKTPTGQIPQLEFPFVNDIKPVLPAQEYEVGPFNVMQRKSVSGDGLDLHHAPQSHLAEQVVPGYQQATGPVIALSETEHGAIPTGTGAYEGTPRELMANTLADLRTYTTAPNRALRELIVLFKLQYPGALDKPSQ